MKRRVFSHSVLAGLITSQTLSWGQTKPQLVIEVWKTATCGCCTSWVSHLKVKGFDVKTHNISDSEKSSLRRRLGLVDSFASCHTGLVGGYLIEGHVGAQDIKRLLDEKPKALGLAAPGMPVGSPGMDDPAYAGRQDKYAVLLVQRDGSSSIFKQYP